MELKVMTVTNEKGSCPETATPPYEFYAKITGANQTYVVTIVMPLGGKESGLFRYPIAEESVLVGIQDGTGGGNYLMGYLPNNTSQPFNVYSDATQKIEDTTGIIADKGEVFRYKKTGINDSPNTEVFDSKNPRPPPKKKMEYSEIGFYNKTTAWKPKGAAADAGYPNIDRINIQSTGDIHSSAENHHRTKAKRFELLVGDDCNGPNYTKNPDDYTREDFAFGDQMGDDPNLYAGDAHIRARNRIIIKAGDEIRLEVGRSAILISDSGITLETRKTRSNIRGPWDTLLEMTPVGGVNLFGHHVKIKSALDFSLGDSYGGELSSILGVTRLTSKDFKAQSTSLYGYMATGIGTSLSYADVIASMIAGAVQGNAKNAWQGMGSTMSFPRTAKLLPELGALVFNTLKGYLDADGTEDSDPVYSLCKALRIGTVVTSLIPIAMDFLISKEQLEKLGGRDGLNTAISAVDLGLCSATFGLLVARLSVAMLAGAMGGGGVAGPLHTSFLHLTGDAGVVLGGVNHKRMSQAEVTAESPLAALQKEKVESPEKSFVEKAKFVGKIVAAIAAGVAVAGGLGVAYFTADKRNQDTLDKLKEL